MSPRAVRWVGYLSYVAVLSVGYYYNLTFVQLGIIDLGDRRVGLGPGRVSGVMAGFAVAALVAAVATGLGVVVAMIGLRLASAIPLLGDLVVGGVLLVGVGAVLVTYLGVSAFRPDSLPEATGP